MVTFTRLYVFLALFTFVYFLESIGGSYMISAVQNIERQFRIPSKLSGFLVSAHDISYVPTVIFISYFGSRGNRAKWIGAGTILIALAHIFTAAPNFVFPVHAPHLNLTQVESKLETSPVLLRPDVGIKDFFEYAPIRDRIPTKTRVLLLDKLESNSSSSKMEGIGINYSNHTKSLYSIDEPLISDILYHIDMVLKNEEDSSELLSALKKFVTNRQEYAESDLKTMRRAAIAPFAFCHRLVNDLRKVIKNIQCEEQASNVGPLLIIFVALLALGVGRTMPWSLGIPLIDDNVKNTNMPVYFAMMSFIRIMGPICGFLIGSVMNKLYYTFPATPPKGLTAQDPTWIGAWWLGFLFIGVITIFPSIVLFFFPESSSKGRRISDKNGSLTNGDVKKPLNDRNKLSLFDRHVEKDADMTTDEKIKTFVGSYREVLHSNVYAGSVAGRVCDVLAFKGYMVFLPKYLENHYGIPQYRVHLYMAVFGVLGFACGTAGGGFITRKFKLNGRSAAFYVLLVSVLNTSLFFTKSFLGCHSVVNLVGRSGIDTNFNYTSSCNFECGCETAKLFPVCDVSGRAFYSPCHAGCRHVSVHDMETYNLEFSECDCAPGGIVKKEYCQDDCKEMKIFFFITVIVGAFLGGTGVVPGMLLLLRSVPPRSRSPALGLNGFLVSLIGTLPSPILWGAIIDSTCLVWDNVCSSRGACQIYDPLKLRVRMHYLYVVVRIFSMMTDIYVLYHAKGLNIQDEEDSGETEKQAEEAADKENITLNVIAP